MTHWLGGIAVAAVLAFGATSLVTVPARAEQGVFDDRIVFGESAAFDGPAAALGLGMREGILASFNEANATGGVNGFYAKASRSQDITNAIKLLFDKATQQARLTQ